MRHNTLPDNIVYIYICVCVKIIEILYIYIPYIIPSNKNANDFHPPQVLHLLFPLRADHRSEGSPGAQGRPDRHQHGGGRRAPGPQPGRAGTGHVGGQHWSSDVLGLFDGGWFIVMIDGFDKLVALYSP